MIVETTAEDYAALCDGRAPRHYRYADTPIAPVEILQMLADVAGEVWKSFSPASWLIVDDDEVIGLCSVTRPPQQGVIDIGYGIAPSRRGRGAATSAVAGIVAWARTSPDVAAITAETSPGNIASRRVLESSGFQNIGERVDEEDGPLICWKIATAEG